MGRLVILRHKTINGEKKYANISTTKSGKNTNIIFPIIEIIKNATNKKHRYLAETIAEEIAEKCLQLKNSITVQVDLAKPDIIEGNTNVGVEIIKRKPKIKVI